MDIKIKDLTTVELVEKLESEIKMYELRKIKHRTSPLNNSAAITLSRREIARMKTEIRQREISNR